MKAIVVFMVSWLVFAVIANDYPLKAGSKKDCCLGMGKDTPCPHQKQNCDHESCNASICHSNLGFIAISSLPVKLFIPLMKKGKVNNNLNRNLPDYSAYFWHPPKV